MGLWGVKVMIEELVREDETLDDLQLKGLHIIQKRNGFRYGVDAVLLANFSKIKKGTEVIDFCTGTGVIPFILAGKTEAALITGIEIQEEFVEMANRSRKYNKLEGKLNFVSQDLKNIDYLKALNKVDVVTVNPPYKQQNSGIVSTNDKSAIARHEIMCTLEQVIIAAKSVLKHNGRMYMIHRPERLADILCTMRKYKIEPKYIRMVYPSVHKAPTMVLIEGQNNGGEFLKWGTALYVYDEKGNFSEEINKIYGRI